MGSLFLNDSEYPDHKPVPSVASEVAKQTSVSSFALAVGLFPLCPVQHHDISVHEHEHVPHHEFVQMRPLISVSAFGSSSSSGDPMTWQNSSMMEAANVAIRRRYALRDAQTRIAGSTSTNSPVVLTSTDASIMWLPTSPAFPGR